MVRILTPAKPILRIARAKSKYSGNLKQGDVSKAAQSNRKQSDR
jgi:hypothetical protein